MGRFFRNFSKFLDDQRVILIIDEFDGIPREAIKGFLHSLRRIYVSNAVSRCPHSVGIVGVKSITQLNYDRTISPFNIQDEFNLPNFTLEQVQELLGQYTDEVGQEVCSKGHCSLFINRLLDNLFLSIGLRRFSQKNLIFRKLSRLRWHTFATAHRAAPPWTEYQH